MSAQGQDRRIDYVELDVGDIARAKDFYKAEKQCFLDEIQSHSW